MLKGLHQAKPDDFDLAMEYAKALPPITNYKKRRMFLELAAKHPDRPEPLIEQASLLYGEFVKKGLGVKDGNWLAAMTRLKALSEHAKREQKPVLENLARQMGLAKSAVRELLNEALKRDPDNVEARMQIASSDWLHKVFAFSESLSGPVQPGRQPKEEMVGTMNGMLDWMREEQELIRKLHRGKPFEHAAPFAIDVMETLLGYMEDAKAGVSVVESLNRLAPRWREQAAALDPARRGLRQMAEEAPDASDRSVAWFWLGLSEIVAGRREVGLQLMERSLLEEPFEALTFYCYERSDQQEYDAAIKAMEAVLAKRYSGTVRVHLAHFQLKAGRRYAVMENAEWFRREVPDDRLHDLIRAADILRNGDEVD